MDTEKLVVHGLTTLELRRKAAKYAEALGYKSDKVWNDIYIGEDLMTFMKLNHHRKHYEFHTHDCHGELISIDNLRELAKIKCTKENNTYPKEMMVGGEHLRLRKRVVLYESGGKYWAVEDCGSMEQYNRLLENESNISLLCWSKACDAVSVSKEEIAEAFGCKVEELSIED